MKPLFPVAFADVELAVPVFRYLLACCQSIPCMVMAGALLPVDMGAGHVRMVQDSRLRTIPRLPPSKRVRSAAPPTIHRI